MSAKELLMYVSESSFEYSAVTLKYKNNNMNEMLNKIKIGESGGNVQSYKLHCDFQRA
jgi:hypothetical protein